jgi:predicted outer membrane repeat protein
MMQSMKIVFFISLIASVLQAKTINIPNDLGTIQAGIDASTSGDTILVQPGSYLENISFNGKNVTLGSLALTTGDTSFISQTIIDGNELDHVVTFEDSEDSTAQLFGFKIINGKSSNGGGIYCNASSPKLVHLIIYNNQAHYGPGIYLRESNAIIRNTMIIQNESIHTYPYRGYGGGIYCTGPNANPILENLSICENQADTKGGAIYCADDANLRLVNCRLTDNEAISVGGGMCCWECGHVSMNNILISGNKGGDGGGGIFTYDSQIEVNNATIVNNAGYGFWDRGTGDKNKEGGGLYIYKGTLTLINSIVTNNIGKYGLFADIGTPQVWFSNFYDNDFGNFYNCGDDIGIDIKTNYYDDPCDIFYNTQINPIFTDYENEDFHLSDSSHCIGTGIDSLALDGSLFTTLKYDLENNPRPSPLGSLPDIGAFENNRDYAVPVELVFFQVFVNQNSVILHWETLSEANNLGFFVERKIPGHPFKTIGFVKGQGTTCEAFDYSFEDKNLTTNSYSYRLRQQDFDGSTHYSKVQTVNVAETSTFTLYQNYPNPFNSSTRIKYDLPDNGQVELAIFNLSGQKIITLFSGYQLAGTYSYLLDIKKLASGLYLYKIMTPEYSQSKRLLVVK